jgi:nucleotide-binding universal stress UspA family protein
MMGGRDMKILIATDGSDSARAAQALVSRIPWPKPTRIELLRVVDLIGLGRERYEHLSEFDEYLATVQKEGDELVAREAERLAGMDAEVSTRCTVGYTYTSNAIVQAAEQFDADLVVVGARGLSPIKRFFIGSVSQHVAGRAPCSVMVVRPTDRTARREGDLRIVYAGDGSPPARCALEELAAVPWGQGVEITALSVAPPPFGRPARSGYEAVELWERIEADAAAELEHAASLLGGTGAEVRTKLITDDDPAEGILAFAEQSQADLVVVGDRGRNAVAKLLLGSVSHRVLTHAPCSVWVARKRRAAQ